MAVDYYTTGYSAFLSGTMNDQQVKQQHPLFRAGYNAAKKQAEQKTKTISDVRVQKERHQHCDVLRSVEYPVP